MDGVLKIKNNKTPAKEYRELILNKIKGLLKDAINKNDDEELNDIEYIVNENSNEIEEM